MVWEAALAVSASGPWFALAAVGQRMTGGPKTSRSTVTTMAALAVIETCVALLTLVTESAGDTRLTVTCPCPVITRSCPTLTALTHSAVLGTDGVTVETWGTPFTVGSGRVPPAILTEAGHVVALIEDVVGVRVTVTVAPLTGVTNHHGVAIETWSTSLTVMSSIALLALAP